VYKNTRRKAQGSPKDETAGVDVTEQPPPELEIAAASGEEPKIAAVTGSSGVNTRTLEPVPSPLANFPGRQTLGNKPSEGQTSGKLAVPESFKAKSQVGTTAGGSENVPPRKAGLKRKRN